MRNALTLLALSLAATSFSMAETSQDIESTSIAGFKETQALAAKCCESNYKDCD